MATAGGDLVPPAVVARSGAWRDSEAYVSSSSFADPRFTRGSGGFALFREVVAKKTAVTGRGASLYSTPQSPGAGRRFRAAVGEAGYTLTR
jgi:hypothetical protein